MNIYDEQIEYLKNHPEDIAVHWAIGKGLFKILEPRESRSMKSGCLTNIRLEQFLFALNLDESVNKEFTLQIRNDERIPAFSKNVTVEHLPVFKEWQEKYDELLRQQRADA